MSKESWKIGGINKSKTYILPMLGFKDHQFVHYSNMPQCQFRNCFIGDSINGTENKILLLYAFSATVLYANFVDTLRKHEHFENLYELDKKHTIFVFSVPEEYKSDYFKVIAGNYSNTSQSYKDHVIKFHGLDAESVTFGVLYKTGKRREELEEVINQGLPKFYWTKIPPFTELEEPFDETEILQPENTNNDNLLIK
jgi:hypothetical protein